MKTKLIFTLTLFIFSLSLFGTNYQEGDTLYVVSFSALTMREEAKQNSKAVQKIEPTSKVVVRNTFNFAEENKDTIEHFAGHWVYISYGDKMGYVFDAYLSKFPIVANFEFDNRDGLDALSMFLSEYAKKVIGIDGSEINYNNGRDGLAAHGMKLQKLIGDYVLIEHFPWEGYSTEVVLENARMAEVYHITKNLLQIFQNKKLEYQVKELDIDFTKITKPSYYQKIPILEENRVFIHKKDSKSISIFFTFPCC